MLELKLSKAPYRGACLLGYYSGTELDVEDNVGLKDYSYLWAENRVGFGGRSRVISYDTGGAHDPLTTSDVVVGNVSARYRDLVDPTPLYWRHQVGSNTDLGTKRRYMYSPTTDSIDPTTVDTAFAAIYDLRKSIRLVEYDGTESTVKWDLNFGDITVSTDRRVAILGDWGWDIYVYVAEESAKDRPLFVEFTSIDADNNIEYVHRELLNPVEYFTSNGIFESAGTAGSVEYAFEADVDNTYQLIAGSEDDAMAIALWTDDADWTWERTADDVIFELSASAELTVDLTGKTVKEVVQEINAANIAVKATLLADYPDATEFIASPVTAKVIGPDGTNPITFGEHYNVLPLYETRFFMEKPREIDNIEEWNPRIRNAHARYDYSSGPLSGATVTYSIPEMDWVTAITGTANPFEYREPATVIRPDIAVTRHRRLIMSTLIVEINGDNGMHLVEDYDAHTGIIKFNQPIDGLDGITISYAHSDDGWYEIENLDLNPIQKHFEDSYRLYVGIYITPSKAVTTPSGPDPLNLKPVVGWAVGNTIAEIETAVDGIQDPTAAFEIESRLIGIFQVSSQQGAADVKVIDIRSLGGGIDQDVDRKKVLDATPEAQFYADIGYWEGEPYPGTGIVVVSGPATILGNSKAVPATPSPNDGGFVDTTGKQDPEDIRRRLKKHSNVGTYNVLDLE